MSPAPAFPLSTQPGFDPYCPLCAKLVDHVQNGSELEWPDHCPTCGATLLPFDVTDGVIVFEAYELSELLPFGPSKLLLDRVTVSGLNTDQPFEATGELTVTRDHCEGHFKRGLQLLRGVDLLEMANQVTAVLAIVHRRQLGFPVLDLGRDPIAGYYRGVGRHRCRGPVLPGQTVRMRVTTKKIGGVRGITICEFDAVGEVASDSGPAPIVHTSIDQCVVFSRPDTPAA